MALQEGLCACLAHRLEDLEAELAGGRPTLMVAAEEAFVTFATLGFRSFQEFEGDVGAGVACAGFAAETSKAIEAPLAAAGHLKDAEDTGTAEALEPMHTECNTSTGASDLAAVHRLGVHVGRAVAIEQMQVSLTAECDRRLGDNPLDSSSRQP